MASQVLIVYLFTRLSLFAYLYLNSCLLIKLLRCEMRGLHIYMSESLFFFYLFISVVLFTSLYPSRFYTRIALFTYLYQSRLVCIFIPESFCLHIYTRIALITYLYACRVVYNTYLYPSRVYVFNTRKALFTYTWVVLFNDLYPRRVFFTY